MRSRRVENLRPGLTGPGAGSSCQDSEYTLLDHCLHARLLLFLEEMTAVTLPAHASGPFTWKIRHALP